MFKIQYGDPFLCITFISLRSVTKIKTDGVKSPKTLGRQKQSAPKFSPLRISLVNIYDSTQTKHPGISIRSYFKF